MKYYFLFLLIISGISSAVASHCSSSAWQDTIAPPKAYSGYRLFVSSVQVVSRSPEVVSIEATLINTGKFNISTDMANLADILEIGYDYTLEQNDLVSLRSQLEKALLSGKLALAAGQIASDFTLSIPLGGPFIGKPVEPEIKTQQEKSSQSVPKPSLDKRKDKNISKSSDPKDNEEPEIVFEVPEFGTKTLEEILEEKNQCPDLVFDTLEVLSQNSKSVTIQYTISNIGKGDADLMGETEKENDNVALRAYLSGAPVLSKGAIVIGGGFVPNQPEKKPVSLKPGQKMKGVIELDIRRKTRYQSVLILSLDAFLNLRECDRTNNTGAIILQ